MTLDEAISEFKERAKEIRENIIDGNNLEPYESYCNAMIERCAEEHEQLAEWLEEFKELRNMAIDDFVNQFNVIVDEKCGTDTNNYFRKIVKEIAEQLKAGVDNV